MRLFATHEIEATDRLLLWVEVLLLLAKVHVFIFFENILKSQFSKPLTKMKSVQECKNGQLWTRIFSSRQTLNIIASDKWCKQYYQEGQMSPLSLHSWSLSTLSALLLLLVVVKSIKWTVLVTNLPWWWGQSSQKDCICTTIEHFVWWNHFSFQIKIKMKLGYGMDTYCLWNNWIFFNLPIFLITLSKTNRAPFTDKKF